MKERTTAAILVVLGCIILIFGLFMLWLYLDGTFLNIFIALGRDIFLDFWISLGIYFFITSLLASILFLKAGISVLTEGPEI